MEYLLKRISYLQGLCDGYDLDTTTNEGKIISELVDILSDVIDEMRESREEIEDYVYENEDMDFDLYDDDFDFDDLEIYDENEEESEEE